MPRTLPVIATEAPGNYQTAALWNAQVAATMQWLLGSGSNGLPMFFGYQATIQAVTNTSPGSAITIDTEIIDTDGGHSTVTNTSRYTCQVAGYYQVLGNVAFASFTSPGATDDRIVSILKNGAAIVGGSQIQGPVVGSHSMSIAAVPMILPLAVGDYIEIYGGWAGTGSLNTQADVSTGKNSSLLVMWIHA